jgi:hypothetical protein
MSERSMPSGRTPAGGGIDGGYRADAASRNEPLPPSTLSKRSFPSKTKSRTGRALSALLLCFALPYAASTLITPGRVATTSGTDAPKISVDDDCSAFAFAPDSSRIVYAAQRLLHSRHLEMQRDDLWVVNLDGKRRRLVNGEKLVQGPAAYSYAIHAVRWSPDGTRLTVEMLTSQMVDASGDTREGELTDLMDENGKEIKIQGADSAIQGASQAVWLADGVTVVYLREAMKPHLLFTVESVRPVAGRGGVLFEGRPFTAVAWDRVRGAAVAIERDPNLSGPIRLVWLDLDKQTVRELAVLDGYLGHLTISPGGSKIAYFRDGDTLEIREVSHPEKVERVPVAYGRYQWALDERRILLKRGPDRQTGELLWVSLPDGMLQPLLHELIFHDFEISPDGHWLAVTQPGKRVLQVYPLP